MGFSNFPFYWIKDKNFDEIKIDDYKLYLTDGSCWNVPSTCIKDKNSFKIKKNNNYIFYVQK